MAKKGLIENNEKRKQMVESYKEQRKKLKTQVMNKKASLESRFEASIRLSQLPRNGAAVRVRSRCIETGRPRGVYSFCGLSRVVLRFRSAHGYMPGVRRSSW